MPISVFTTSRFVASRVQSKAYIDCRPPVLTPLALGNRLPCEVEIVWERERGTHADFSLMSVYFYVCCEIHCFYEVLANRGKVYILSITALPKTLSLWCPRIAITALPYSLRSAHRKKGPIFLLLRFFFAHVTFIV